LIDENHSSYSSTITSSMKKTFTSLLICLLALTAVRAQDVTVGGGDQRFAIKINPLSIFILTGNIQAEAAISDRMSVQLGVFGTALTLGAGTSEASGRVGYNLLGITPELRFYLLKGQNAPRGLYVAPFARVQTGKIFATASVFDPTVNSSVSAEVTSRLLSIGGGVTIGYQLITRGGFVMDVFTGPQFANASVTSEAVCDGCNGDEEIPSIGRSIGSGVGLRLGMALGYAF
jgi:Protein of unknown function (DUF3575)